MCSFKEKSEVWTRCAHHCALQHYGQATWNKEGQTPITQTWQESQPPAASRLLQLGGGGALLQFGCSIIWGAKWQLEPLQPLLTSPLSYLRQPMCLTENQFSIDSNTDWTWWKGVWSSTTHPTLCDHKYNFSGEPHLFAQRFFFFFVLLKKKESSFSNIPALFDRMTNCPHSCL